MPQPRFEVASGAIDGSNRTFFVSTAYLPRTLAVFVNGILYRRDWDDGWDETDPSAGEFRTKVAPLPGDSVQAFFTDLSAARPEQEITPIHGQLHEVLETRGLVLEMEIRAVVAPEAGSIDGRLLDAQPVLGALEDTEVLHTVIEVIN